MFGFSFGEICVVSVVALLVLGPERIPQVARTLGKLFAELRRATDEVKREFNYNEFTRSNSPLNLNLPISASLRTEGLVIDPPDQPAATSQDSVEIQPILNCEEMPKSEPTKI